MNQELLVVAMQLQEIHDKLHRLLPKIESRAVSEINECLMTLQRVIMAVEKANKD